MISRHKTLRKENVQTLKLPMDQLQFLQQCAEFESKVATLYHHYSDLFSDDESLSMLFKKTAVEEENHAQQFHLAIRLQGTGMEAVKTDVTKASASLKKLAEIVELLTGSTPFPEDALDIAIRLEEQVALLHMANVVHFQDAGLKQLFEAMMAHDNGHVTMLKDYREVIRMGKSVMEFC